MKNDDQQQLSFDDVAAEKQWRQCLATRLLHREGYYDVRKSKHPAAYRWAQKQIKKNTTTEESESEEPLNPIFARIYKYFMATEHSSVVDRQMIMELWM